MEEPKRSFLIANPLEHILSQTEAYDSLRKHQEEPTTAIFRITEIELMIRYMQGPGDLRLTAPPSIYASPCHTVSKYCFLVSPV